MFLRIWNSAVFWSFVVTGLRTGGFLLILPLVVRTLSPEELGFWFVLLGLVQAASLLELGFAPTIGRFTSYYMGGAAVIPARGLPAISATNAPPNFAGIAGLVASAQKLYRCLGLATGSSFVILGGGWLAWRYPEAMNSPKAWLAFALLGAGTGFAMSQYFWGAVLAGMHRVREQQRIFFTGLVLNYTIIAVGIPMGAGIFALVLGQLALGLVPRWKARAKVRETISKNISGIAGIISWETLWPTTWRNYLIQLCSYFLLPATALVCAATTSLATTAQYGLSLQLGLVLHGVAASWQAVKMPQIAALLAAGRVQEIENLTRKRLLLTFLTFAFGSFVALACGPLFFERIKSQTPLLPTGAFAILLCAVATDLWSGSFSALLQTTNRAPHLPWFCLASVAGVLLGVLLGHVYGPAGISAACILVQMAFCVWSVPWFWIRQVRHLSLQAAQT